MVLQEESSIHIFVIIIVIDCPRQQNKLYRFPRTTNDNCFIVNMESHSVAIIKQQINYSLDTYRECNCLQFNLQNACGHNMFLPVVAHSNLHNAI